MESSEEVKKPSPSLFVGQKPREKPMFLDRIAQIIPADNWWAVFEDKHSPNELKVEKIVCFALTFPNCTDAGYLSRLKYNDKYFYTDLQTGRIKPIIIFNNMVDTEFAEDYIPLGYFYAKSKEEILQQYREREEYYKKIEENHQKEKIARQTVGLKAIKS
ncbi:hypothetical protein MUP77_16115 [Candidatus Bathyarchaeota archaeon]|nr:hypothetical protein [Candidatus Bathyarchaeota archaeon]